MPNILGYNKKTKRFELEDGFFTLEVDGMIISEDKLTDFQFGEFVRTCLGKNPLIFEDARGRKKVKETPVVKEKKQDLGPVREPTIEIVEKEVVVDGKKMMFPVKVVKVL